MASPEQFLGTRIYLAGAPAAAPAGQLASEQTQTISTPANSPPARPPASIPAGSLGPRHALVIGNSRYTASLGTLPNASRDADMVASALRASGFTVDVVRDADQRTMKQAIARFGQRLLSAGRNATALFYYAGHGVQSHGANYLIPVSANLQTEADVDLDGVQADAVLSQITQSGASTRIVILDACRNMPFSRTSRDGTRGLARMDASNGSFISYSTAPGDTAADGTGTNSPFAQALVAEMARPDQPIEIMFRNVRNAVYRATGGKQTPWDSSSLFDSFVFTPTKR